MPGPDHGSADRAASTSPPGGRTVLAAQSWSAPERVGWRFVTLYALSYTGGSLLFLAPLLVSLALKVNDLVGIEAAPRNLAMVTGVGSLFSIVANPLFGRLSDRTTVTRRDATPLDGDRGGSRSGRDPGRRHRYEHHGRARRLVRVSGVLQRHPGRSGRRPAGPGSRPSSGGWSPGFSG